MAVASRKRKAAGEETIASKQTTCTTTLKTAKSSTTPGNVDDVKQSQKRRRTGNSRSSTPPPPAIGSAKLSTKRKRTLDSVAEQSDEDRERKLKIEDGFFKKFAEQSNEERERKFKVQDGFFKKFAKPKTTGTPQSSRFKNTLPSPAQTPTRNAQQLFDQLNIRATSPAAQPPSKRSRTLDTPPTSPDVDKVQPNAVLPDDLRDLLSLHSSFLTAWSLHSAHNSGSQSAVNIKVLLPMVTANWRKRSVTVIDIRKILALTQKSGPSFQLEDRARAGIFLARVAPNEQDTQRQSSYIDEAALNVVFETSLREAWAEWSSKTPEELLTGRSFVRQLPQIEMAQNEATKNATPLFSRGQQRLADLKAGQAAAKTEAETSQSPAPSTANKSASGILSRNTSLLDRILAKQASTAAMPAGPTKTELERKSALHRIEDVTRVLDMLAAGQMRASFSMPAVVQHLQQSLRSPITREETERCLGIMATEIMPSFVKIVASGALKGVVVTKGGKIGFADLKERLANAGA